MVDTDLYTILEVAPDATAKEIKSSYRRLARKYHPDVNPNGEKHFLIVQRAYDILRDPVIRRRYDGLRLYERIRPDIENGAIVLETTHSDPDRFSAEWFARNRDETLAWFDVWQSWADKGGAPRETEAF